MFDINLEDYNYGLPEERIAQYPLEERDSSRLLIYRNGKITENLFRNIHEYIPTGTLLVFNNTKVIRARLLFKKETGAKIEILLLEPVLPSEYSMSLGSGDPVEWKCLIGNLRKWKGTTISSVFGEGKNNYKLFADRIADLGDCWRIRFSWNNKLLTFGEIIESAGHIPLPPYIHREDEKDDAGRYQTIYSTVRGSVAAPTAGLHFTKKSFSDLSRKGILTADLTLHIGAGTFQPVKSDNIESHEMHTEHFSLDSRAIESVLKNIGNIIAVGTTTVRALESLYWLGIKLCLNNDADPSELFVGQWEPYILNSSLQAERSIESVLSWMIKKGLSTLHLPTRIIIVPGYNFRIVEGLITNFHLPKSTLLLLVSAFTGNRWKEIYSYALENDFRFLSYGDSSILLK